jgi:hypothetical protein
MPSIVPTHPESLEPSLRELVELFAGPLATLTFPGVDSRALVTLAAQVEADASELARLEATVAALRARLTDARDELLPRAQRALAYARVYADGDGSAELAARLDALVLPRPRPARPTPGASATASPPDAAPRKRGRPRKDATAAATTLFTTAPTAPPSA